MQTQIEIYKLDPNTTYRFRVWSSNKLGPGDYSEITATTTETSHKEGIFYSLFNYFLIY